MHPDVDWGGAVDMSAFRQEVAPDKNVDAGIIRAISARMWASKDGRGRRRLKQHEFVAVGRRDAQRNISTQVIRQGLKEWLKSPAGARWQLQRDALLNHPDYSGDDDCLA